MKSAMLGLIAAVVLTHPLTSTAVIFDFERITASSSSDVAAQLSVDVLACGTNQAEFRFANAGPLSSVIAGIYFDDGTLLGIASVVNSPPGVVFEQGGTPGHLPAGNSIAPPFETTAGFLATADNPRPFKGVGPGEFVSIIFSLKSGGTYDTVLDELDTGELRIGLHVQSLPDGKSDSFVNTPGGGEIPVPETGSSALILAASLSVLSALYRRRA